MTLRATRFGDYPISTRCPQTADSGTCEWPDAVPARARRPLGQNFSPEIKDLSVALGPPHACGSS